MGKIFDKIFVKVIIQSLKMVKMGEFNLVNLVVVQATVQIQIQITKINTNNCGLEDFINLNTEIKSSAFCSFCVSKLFLFIPLFRKISFSDMITSLRNYFLKTMCIKLKLSR